MARLSDALPIGKQAGPSSIIGVLPGEGVGPEVVAGALKVLDALASISDRRFDIRRGGLIGEPAVKASGKSLNEQAINFCDAVFAEGGALFCGPGGARFVYDLRARYDLFCKFTPLQPVAALRDVGALRPERSKNVDIIAVRENTGGLYFGPWARDVDAKGRASACQQVAYHEDQVNRILDVACRLAASRRGKLCLVLKREGIPAISNLWLESLERIRQAIPVTVEMLDIDNAVYQIIADAHRFDVLVSPNMFGDVLADCGALLLGSRGMSYSGNFSPDGKAVYQTGHGAAHDIAGKDIANPVGQIMALAMMLEESFCWPEGADIIREACAAVMAAGLRTGDIAASDSRTLGTGKMVAAICDKVKSCVRP